jgi:geranylgeranyl pyrophosphate synthase
MNGTLQDFLSAARADVDHHLERFIATLPDDRLRSAMAYSVFNGGKRIRPALCYAAANVFGPANELVHRASAALELIHAYSLVHDDLPAMDDDDLRRGKPTCHIAFDEATAILAGDALQTLAFDILAAPSDEAQTQLCLIRTLAAASGAQGMVLGQSLDLAAVDKTLSYGELERMHRHKTGALIHASLHMGAIATGLASAQELDVLSRYGSAIGLAFQIKDDILDVESSTEVLGKTQGADLSLNKPTYTSIMGLEGAKARLAEMHGFAREAAASFGSQGAILLDIADFIVERSH